MPSDDNFTTLEIPIFPLPVVLLPSEVMPLHIFEERYKTMLKDCLAGKKVFGISYHTEKDSWPPSLGKVGTIAQIMAVVPLDDGRMNILTIGTQRYRLKEYREQTPYLHAEVETFQDGSDDGSAQEMLPEIIALYKRASGALKE